MIGHSSILPFAKIPTSGKGAASNLVIQNWKPQLLFESDTIDTANNLWLDKSGNDNDITLCQFPCFVANNAGGYYMNTPNYIKGFTFTIYGEFIYSGVNVTSIISFASKVSTSYWCDLRITTNKLCIYDKLKATTYSGATTLVSGHHYKYLIVATSKDDIKIYFDGSDIADLTIANQNFTWYNTYDFMIGMLRRTTDTYQLSGTSFNIKLSKNAVKTWTTIHTQYDNWWAGYLTLDKKLADYSKQNDLLPLNITSANISTQDITGYYDGSDEIVTPCSIKVPYSAAMASVDTILGGLLFTGVTPNAIPIDNIWVNQNEAFVMFANKCLWNIKELLICDSVQVVSNKNAIYKRIEYSTTPILHLNNSLSDSSGHNNNALVSSLVYDNDGFTLQLNDSLVKATDNAGAYGYFFNRTFVNSVPIRFSDLPNVMGRSFFCNRTNELRVYSKDLLPSDMATVINDMFAITDVDFYITTKNGYDYQNIDGERYTLASGALNLNPSASANTKYDIFDRRNVVGSAKEIWDAALVLGSAYWTWNHTTGTYKLNQGTVYKFIQAAYKDRVFWNQEYTITNGIVLREIVVFKAALSGAAKTAMYAHIDFPETFTEPTIVGNAITDDALAINTAMGTDSNVLLYAKDARVLTSVKIPDNVRLTLIDSTIKATAEIRLNTVRNDDFDLGNENIQIYGYGTSIIDGDGAEQVRDEPNYFDAVYYTYTNMFFCDVTNLKLKGFQTKNPAANNIICQICTGLEARNIHFIDAATQANTNGINGGWGLQYGSIMFLTGQTGDDTCDINNMDANHNQGYHGRNGRATTNIFYRDIYAYPIADGHVFASYCNKTCTLQNIKIFNVFNASMQKALFRTGSYLISPDIEGVPGYWGNFYLRNYIGGCTGTRAFWFANKINLQDVDFDNMIFNTVSLYHIDLIVNGILTNVSIKSILNVAPTTLITDAGATLTNFVHEEITNY